jgi:predicted PurR-regulated permease PerM
MLLFTLIHFPDGCFSPGAAALLELVPLIWRLTAAVLTLGVAALSDFPHLLCLIICFVAYRPSQDYVLNPLLMSSGTEMNPLLVISGVPAGEQLGGVPGVLLAIPVLWTANILAYHLRQCSETRPEADILPQDMSDPGRLTDSDRPLFWEASTIRSKDTENLVCSVARCSENGPRLP